MKHRNTLIYNIYIAYLQLKIYLGIPIWHIGINIYTTLYSFDILFLDNLAEYCFPLYI